MRTKKIHTVSAMKKIWLRITIAITSRSMNMFAGLAQLKGKKRFNSTGVFMFNVDVRNVR